MVHMTHPRYFGLFNPAPNFPAQWADRIAGAFNPQLASTGSSPVPVEIEAHVIRALAARAGMPSRQRRAFHDQRLRGELHRAGVRPDACRSRIRQRGRARLRRARGAVHLGGMSSGLVKIAHQAGVGRRALRLVATDGSGRLDAAALEDMVRPTIGARRHAGADRRNRGHDGRRHD